LRGNGYIFRLATGPCAIPAAHGIAHDHLVQRHEPPAGKRPETLVFILRHLDEYIFHHLCTGTMEKNKTGLELILQYFKEFTPRQLEQLEALGPLYAEWNEKINVISRKDIEFLYEKHILHSLAIAAVFDFAPGTRILDLGTGGGFPGIPLAIFFPQSTFHLVDGINKKLKVVQAVAEAAGLTNITTQHGRAEEIQHQKFDYIVSRAVAPLASLWRWSRPLLRTNSAAAKGTDNTTRHSLICLKGGDLTTEISESGLRPLAWPVAQMFDGEFFKEKYLLAVMR
jgi:16S rRNA (guanine527-N7)-methyltransferase